MVDGLSAGTPPASGLSPSAACRRGRFSGSGRAGGCSRRRSPPWPRRSGARPRSPAGRRRRSVPRHRFRRGWSADLPALARVTLKGAVSPWKHPRLVRRPGPGRTENAPGQARLLEFMLHLCCRNCCSKHCSINSLGCRPFTLRAGPQMGAGVFNKCGKCRIFRYSRAVRPARTAGLRACGMAPCRLPRRLVTMRRGRCVCRLGAVRHAAAQDRSEGRPGTGSRPCQR